MTKKKRPVYSGDKESQLPHLLASAQARFHSKLMALDVESLGISEYNKRYLREKIQDDMATIELCGRLLFLSLRDSPIPLDRFVLADYGGGSGMLSFLAKEIGIDTVIYNDIYDVSCNDVKLLSAAFELALDHIVCGDIDDLISYLHNKSICIDAITSYDVIEHIYDLAYHFKRLPALSKGQFRVVYASGANMKNPWLVYAIMKKQTNAEYRNREKMYGHKERDTLRSYLDVRKEIISTYAKDLSPEQVVQVARATRGLIKPDIERCVDEFRATKSLHHHPNHPTNTCDPYTGNWCEHLMSTQWIKQIMGDAGYSVNILVGHYAVSGSLLKKTIKYILNVAMRLLGRWAMFIAPYYIVYGNHYGVKLPHTEGYRAL
jgi:hypothetical protein